MIPPLKVEPAREQGPLAGVPYHRWEQDGELWAEFRRQGDAVLVRFPGLVDFAVPGDASHAVCWPAPGVGEATRDHLYINQVLPLLHARRGRLAFHASAVSLDVGAVAFVGESGRGKSTMAASFAAAGHPFLTDDGLILRESGGRYQVEPTHPSLRLWDDSRDALGVSGAVLAPAVAFTDKARLLAGGALPFCDGAQPLCAAYFLSAEEADEPRFVQLTGAELLQAWMSHSFLLDLDEPEALRQHFGALAGFCAAIPSFRLDYPRDYGSLESVRRRIADHAAAERLP